MSAAATRAGDIGNRRSRVPVSWNTALAIDGATHGTPISPRPLGGLSVAMTRAWISGMSLMRGTEYWWKFVCTTPPFLIVSSSKSAPLLEFLFRHQVKLEFTCRWQWRVGDLAFWDNRCTQHNPVNDYHGHRRVMHRITLAGDRPR